MDTQHLKTFIQLSSTKNFTQTAKLLFVAQSTVTIKSYYTYKYDDPFVLTKIIPLIEA